MAFPLPRGLTPPEIAFLCEMELVTVIPRLRLEGLELLGGPIEPLIPPRRGLLPLWLAVLLKRQRHANIVPPSWLNVGVLSSILELETDHPEFRDSFLPPPPLPSSDSSKSRRGRKHSTVPHFTLDGQKYTPSPPFVTQNTAEDNLSPDDVVIPSLPYHWLELATILLDVASDDLVEPDRIRRLIRDLREARMAKMRKIMEGVDATAIGGGEGLVLTGAGAMEIGEARAFMSGVAETLRQIGAPKEEAMRERGEYGEGMDYEANAYDEGDEMEL
ncbi:hypothetical protein VTO42DRAFT_2308 [Malbranchea cinnamomea]